MAGAGAGGATPPNAVKAISAARFPGNPLIAPESGRSVGENINGPSVIRVPEWIENPLGRYYMYFASHSGDSIRLAYADSPRGPWKVHDPGTLRLDQARPFKTSRPAHIASPDAHVDEAREEILMYFHGVPEGKGGQATGVAISKDGLAFEPMDRILGRFYFRVFRWKGAFYALAKHGNAGWGTLSRSSDGLSRFDERACFIKDMRHAAVMLRGDILLVFHSRVGDAPERIVVSTVRLSGDWRDWAASEPIDVLSPDEGYEGVGYPIAPSRHGAAIGVRQLRDPCVFEDDGKAFLYYSCAGEMGIAGAELSISMHA